MESIPPPSPTSAASRSPEKSSFPSTNTPSTLQIESTNNQKVDDGSQQQEQSLSPRDDPENDFIERFLVDPDVARQHACSGMECFDDVNQILSAWAHTEKNYGTSLDRIVAGADKLNTVKCTKGTVSALAAIVGSFQSAGKHHLGLQIAIDNEVTTILKPALKSQREKYENALSSQLAIQKEVTRLRDSLKRLKEEGAPEDKIMSTSSKYDAKTTEQGEKLEHFVRTQFKLIYGRLGLLSMSFLRIQQSNEHVLNFHDEIAKAMKDILANTDIDRDLASDLTSLVNIESEIIDKDCIDSDSITAKVFEVLGSVEPDVASASVDAVGDLCSSSMTMGHVALRIIETLQRAVDERAHAVSQVASGANMTLTYLNQIAVRGEELLSEEMDLDSERRAWRTFMVSMQQSALVLKGWSQQLQELTRSLHVLVASSETAKKQVLAARSAANKELQICAHALKSARADLEAMEDSVNKMEQSKTRANSDVSDIKFRMDKIRDGKITTGEEASGNVVQRFLGLPVQTPEQQLAEAEKKAEIMSNKLANEKSEKENLVHAVKDCSMRLEAQVSAYAVQMAGTVSMFVSTYAGIMHKFHNCLMQLVEGTGNTIFVIRKLQDKMMRELCRIDPVADIQNFIKIGAHKNTKIQPIIQPPISFKPTIRKTAHNHTTKEGSSTHGTAEGVRLKSQAEIKIPTHIAVFKLPENEEVVGTYSCAYLPGKMPQQGYMTLTNHFLCFRTLQIYEPMLGSCKLVVEVADISKISKARGAWGLVANSLSLQIKPLTDGAAPTVLEFTSLFYRDQCYDTLIQLASSPRITHSSTEWKSLDPRNGDKYVGNELQAASDDNRSKRRSTFLKLGHSTTDLEAMSQEMEKADLERQQSSELFVAKTDTPKRQQKISFPPCKTCSAAFSPQQPCGCWTLAIPEPKQNKKYSGIGESFWNGNVSNVVAQLFLGNNSNDAIKLEAETMIVLHRTFDVSKEVGESTGDYDLDFPEFRYGETGLGDVLQFERSGYAPVLPAPDDDDTPNAPVLYRVVSFSHPIPNTLLGKQVAKTTQLQTICGMIKKENGVVNAKNDKTSVIFNTDTSLAGFPYSDSFTVRTRYVVTPMKHTGKEPPSGDQAEAWCKVTAHVKINWVKSVSVPFLKGKIEKENLATGKTTFLDFLQCASRHIVSEGTIFEEVSTEQSAKVSPRKPMSPIAAATSKMLPPRVSSAITSMPVNSIMELFNFEFCVSAWNESSNAQKLQTMLLLVIILLQLLSIIF